MSTSSTPFQELPPLDLQLGGSHLTEHLRYETVEEEISCKVEVVDELAELLPSQQPHGVAVRQTGAAKEWVEERVQSQGMTGKL